MHNYHRFLAIAPIFFTGNCTEKNFDDIFSSFKHCYLTVPQLIFKNLFCILYFLVYISIYPKQVPQGCIVGEITVGESWQLCAIVKFLISKSASSVADLLPFHVQLLKLLCIWRRFWEKNWCSLSFWRQFFTLHFTLFNLGLRYVADLQWVFVCYQNKDLRPNCCLENLI